MTIRCQYAIWKKVMSHIKNADDLYSTLVKKVEKDRKLLQRALRNPFSSIRKENYMAHEFEQGVITPQTLLSEAAFNSFISRIVASKLNGMDGRKLKFVNGRTRIEDVVRFYYPNWKEKPKKKERRKQKMKRNDCSP